MKSAVAQLLLASSAALAEENGSRGDVSCPTAIRQTIPAYTWTDGERVERPAFSSMAGIHAALLRCPDIATLQVRTTLMGCSDWPDRFNFPFDFRGGDHYRSAPQVLSLEGYDADEIESSPCEDRFAPFWRERIAFWTQPRRAWQCRDYVPLPEAQRNKTNLDLWLDAMDFSQIHTLQLNHTDGRYTLTEQVVQKLPSRLTSLKSLAVCNGIGEQFILALPRSSLTHLSWQNPSRGRNGDWDAALPKPLPPLEPVLRHQGSLLLSFDYHTDESESLARQTLNVKEVGQLVTLAPGLQSLTLDLNRQPDGIGSGGQSWPWESLRVLAQGLPELTDMTIYFDMASECHREESRANPWGLYRPDEISNCTEHHAQPRLNRASAAEMARFLWQHQAGQRLSRVSFRAGDWTRSWDGPIRGGESWLEGRRDSVVCRVDQLAAAAEGVATISGDIVCDTDHDVPFSYFS